MKPTIDIPTKPLLDFFESFSGTSWIALGKCDRCSKHPKEYGQLCYNCNERKKAHGE